jgi:hypothetical protein
MLIPTPEIPSTPNSVALRSTKLWQPDKSQEISGVEFSPITLTSQRRYADMSGDLL